MDEATRVCHANTRKQQAARLAEEAAKARSREEVRRNAISARALANDALAQRRLDQRDTAPTDSATKLVEVYKKSGGAAAFAARRAARAANEAELREKAIAHAARVAERRLDPRTSAERLAGLDRHIEGN